MYYLCINNKSSHFRWLIGLTCERGWFPSLFYSVLILSKMYITSEPEAPFDKYDEMRLHMEQLLSASITDFDIPMRIAIPLDGAV